MVTFLHFIFYSDKYLLSPWPNNIGSLLQQSQKNKQSSQDGKLNDSSLSLEGSNFH